MSLAKLIQRIRRPPYDSMRARLEAELKQRTRDLIDVEQELEQAKAQLTALQVQIRQLEQDWRRIAAIGQRKAWDRVDERATLLDDCADQLAALVPHVGDVEPR